MTTVICIIAIALSCFAILLPLWIKADNNPNNKTNALINKDNDNILETDEVLLDIHGTHEYPLYLNTKSKAVFYTRNKVRNSQPYNVYIRGERKEQILKKYKDYLK